MKKLVSILITLVFVLSSSISIVYADELNNSEIVSVQTFDNSDLQNEINNVSTEEDILELSHEVQVTKVNQEDDISQYIIQEDPSSIITYSDGSVINTREAVSFFVMSTSPVYTHDHTVEGYSEESTDCILRVTLIWQECTYTDSEKQMTLIKIIGGSSAIVKNNENYMRNLKISLRASGEADDPATGQLVGLLSEGNLVGTVNNPNIGTTYSLGGSSVTNYFTHWYRTDMSGIACNTSIELSHGGTNYYTLNLSYNQGSFPIIF